MRDAARFAAARTKMRSSLHVATIRYRSTSYQRRNNKMPVRELPTRPYHDQRSEEHTSELQSLMRISYAVFCLKKKKIQQTNGLHMVKQTQHHIKIHINTHNRLRLYEHINTAQHTQ